MMRILFVHNYYREQGGEDVSFHHEMDLLTQHGHIVESYTRDNHEIEDRSLVAKYHLFRETAWSQKTVTEIQKKIKEFQPQIVHVQNFFPLISPSVFSTCKAEGIPVVFSVRNYRLLCPNGLFFRDGHPCEDCLGKSFPYPGIIHACYRNSRLQTLAVAAMLGENNSRRTWQTNVDRFIALSHFAARKLEEGGLETGKISVKPNFLNDPGMVRERDNYAVFIGRLSPEKGVNTLIQAIKQLRQIPLKVIGTGPSKNQIIEQVRELHKVELLGHLSYEQMLTILQNARLLICPSEWYETFGRVVIEAYSCGVPVVASRIGALAELVNDQQTGLLFKPGDELDLASKLEWLWSHTADMDRMGKFARKEYLQKYTPDVNYGQLMGIYQQVLDNPR
jgi:glycosyltransferase involved in cell wall biosynthesis